MELKKQNKTADMKKYHREYQREYYKKNPEKILLEQNIRRIKKDFPFVDKDNYYQWCKYRCLYKKLKSLINEKELDEDFIRKSIDFIYEK